MAQDELMVDLKDLRVTWKGQKINKDTKVVTNQIQCVQVDNEGREESFIITPTDEGYLNISPGDKIQVYGRSKAFRDKIYTSMVRYEIISAGEKTAKVRL